MAKHNSSTASVTSLPMSAADNSSAKTSILLVDDSRTVRAGLSKILNQTYTIIEADNGEAGWQKLQDNNAIKLVITDIMMPKLDGYGLICRIRGAEQDRMSKLPIIVVTSAEDEISRERAHACGANNFIVKPASAQDLLERVNFHTEKHLSGDPATAPQMAQYESQIENTVIEAPTLDLAIDILENGETGGLKPYAVELAIKILPLLKYCNGTFDMDVFSEIQTLEDKLKAL